MTAEMSVKLIFRCQCCDAQPDPPTQICLEKSVPELVWGVMPKWGYGPQVR